MGNRPSDACQQIVRGASVGFPTFVKRLPTADYERDANGVSSPVVQQCKNRPTDDDHAVINQAPTILRVVTNHGGYAVANYLISSAVSFKFFSSRSASIVRCPLAFSVRIVSSRRLISACNSRKTLVRGLPISSIQKCLMRGA